MAITITDNRYKVTGKLTNINGEPLAQLVIKALDKDFSKNDYLGSAISQKDGSFQITFAQKAFRDLFDRKPDLFFEVFKNDTKILSTSAMTIGNAEANDLPFHLVIDLPSPEIKEEIQHPVEQEESDDFAVTGTEDIIEDNSGDDVILGGGSGDTTQESNYLASNLSADKHTYDLVVATTGKAINATMKRFLRKAEFTEKIIWYKEVFESEDENFDLEEDTLFKVMEPIPGIDPFAIMNKEDIPPELMDSDFSFAVKASFGLPPGVKGTEISDIIVLDEGNENVTYKMFFETMQIALLEFGRRGPKWSNISQPSGKQWIFKFKVPLKSLRSPRTEKFEDADEAIRDELLRLNADDSFSVHQLFIDLNRASPSKMPKIEGLPDGKRAKRVLKTMFLPNYWEHIKTSKDPIFGYSVTRSKNEDASFVQATALDYQVMPHLNKDGHPSENHDLYTLNYRMMTGSNPLPIGAGLFNWNWVRSDEAGELHGAMAIRRKVFADFLNETLSKKLGSVCLKPTVTFTSTAFESEETAKVAPDTSPGKFTYNESGKEKILTLNYNKESRAEDETFAGDGHFALTSKVIGDVTVAGSEMTINLHSQLDIDYHSPVIKPLKVDFNSFLIKSSSKAKYKLSVDASGKISAVLAAGFPQVNTQQLDPIAEALLGTFSVGSNLPNEIISSYKQIETAFKDYANEIDDFINQSGNKWVFPGGKTFVFKDAAFSESQDLVTHISYALQ